MDCTPLDYFVVFANFQPLRSQSTSFALCSLSLSLCLCVYPRTAASLYSRTAGRQMYTSEEGERKMYSDPREANVVHQGGGLQGRRRRGNRFVGHSLLVKVSHSHLIDRTCFLKAAEFHLLCPKDTTTIEFRPFFSEILK